METNIINNSLESNDDSNILHPTNSELHDENDSKRDDFSVERELKINDQDDFPETPESSSFLDFYKDDYSVEEPSGPKRGRPKSMSQRKNYKKLKTKNIFLYKYHQDRRDAKQFENETAIPFIFENENVKLHNGFSLGMSLEAVDPVNPNIFCAVSVSAVSGPRIRLNFDGYSSCYDFWVTFDSPFIFPVGWCERNNRPLQPPFEYADFDWSTYLSENAKVAAPEELFRVHEDIKPPSFFRIGMKLVAVESEYLPAYPINRIATIDDIIGDYLLVRFDGISSFSGFWTKTDSPSIYPLETFTDDLEVPDDFHGDFSKANYLEATNAFVAPASLFKMRQPTGFPQGMRIETVDNYNHDLIREASIALIRGYRVKIHLNGWPKPYDYWLDDDTTQIYPTGHCEKYGIKLISRMPANKYKNVLCSTTICSGYGHFSGRPDSTHICHDDCPYKNHVPKRIKNRLAPEEVPTPLPEESFESFKRPRGYLNLVDSSSQLSHSSMEMSSFPKRRRKRSNNWRHATGNGNDDKYQSSNESNEFTRENYEQHYQLEELFDPPNFCRLKEVSSILRPNMQPKKAEVLTWNCDQVAKFIASIHGCGDIVARVFTDNKINGKAFLMMQQSDFTNIFKLKLGPSLKIYYHVLIFRDSNVLLNPYV